MLKAIQDIKGKFKAKKTDDASVASSSAPPSPRHRVDHHVTDPNTNVVYIRGKVLGKGGFATCYEFINTQTREVFAAKVMGKRNFIKSHQKLRVTREVEIHKSMRHKNVVGFHGYFEDSDNVYIVLENCTNKSLTQLLKVRRALPEPEVRYFMHQLLEGCRHVHSNNIIHRDIKLGNLLLDRNMELKICDFGLATRVHYEGEKKVTVCGTPNYIAPEVLMARGHSYEADMWSIGCVMYTLLVGIPPFETNSLEETYQRIRTGTFYIPGHVSMAARTLIQRMLCVDPQKRMSVDRAMNDKFFHGFMPKTVFPLVDHTEAHARKSHRVDRLINGQVKDTVKEKDKARRSRLHQGEGGGVGGEVSDVTHQHFSANTSRGEEKMEEDGGQGITQVSDKSEEEEEEHSSDENKENDAKVGLTANVTNLSMTRNDTCIDERDDGTAKERKASDGLSVMPWDVCMSFVDRSVAIDSAGFDSAPLGGGKAFTFPLPTPQHKSDDDTPPPQSPTSDLDIKEEIARFESAHKSAFLSASRGSRGGTRGGRRRLASPALQIANRPRMEDISEVSGSYGPSSLPDTDAMPQSLTQLQLRSVHKYDAVWRTPNLDPAQEDEQDDDVMTEEEERAAMQQVQQDFVNRRRSSVAKMVLCSLSEEEDSSDDSSSPPPSRASHAKRRNAARIVPPARRNGSLDINFNRNHDNEDEHDRGGDKFSPEAIAFAENSKPRVVRASSLKVQSFDLPTTPSPTKTHTFELPTNPANSSHVQAFDATTSTISAQNSFHMTRKADTDKTQTPDTSESTAHRFPKEKWTTSGDKLRKTRSVTSLPTQTLEQVIGQLCAERFSPRRHTTVAPSPLQGDQKSAHQSMEQQNPRSAYHSPADTPSTSARASPAPTHRKKMSPTDTPSTSAKPSPVMRRKTSQVETPPTTSAKTSPVMRRKLSQVETPPTLSAATSPVNHRKLSPTTPPTTSTRGSPAPVRRKKSTSSKVDKQRRHTSLGIEVAPVITGERTVGAPGTGASDNIFVRQSSVTSESEGQEVDDRAVRRSASTTPYSERRRRYKSTKNAVSEPVKVTDIDDTGDTVDTGETGENGREQEADIQSSPQTPSPPTHITNLRHSRTLAEFSSVETVDNCKMPTLPEKKNHSRYASTDSIALSQCFEGELQTSYQAPDMTGDTSTYVHTPGIPLPPASGHAKRSALNMYTELNKCVEKVKIVDVAKPLSGDRHTLYVAKWVDYTNKYGFGFQLSDNSVGVLFNNKSWMTLSPTGRFIDYHDAEQNTDLRYQSVAMPTELKKKASLLSYFARYMNTHLSMSDRGSVSHGLQHLAAPPVDKDEPTVAVRRWHRTKNTVVMYLSNGSLQVNSLEDHTKVIISPHAHVTNEYVVTSVSRHKEVEHYSLLHLRQGCTKQLLHKLTLAKDMLSLFVGIKEASV